jgi:hypothetical protein
MNYENPGPADPLGVTWFSWPTLMREARAIGLDARHTPQYTELFTRMRPRECHDWIIFTPADRSPAS